jgi:hypothetical protein
MKLKTSGKTKGSFESFTELGIFLNGWSNIIKSNYVTPSGFNFILHDVFYNNVIPSGLV